MSSTATPTRSNGDIPPTTVRGAINIAADVHSRLAEAAGIAEKLAETVDGPSPSDAATTKGDAPKPASMADHLTQAVDGLHSPTTRIFLALERISLRIG